MQLGDALTKVEALPILKNPPPGLGRASQGQEQALAGTDVSASCMAFAEAIGLVYVVMVLLFRSFFKPVIIMLALPTAVGGAFLALLLGGSMLGIPSLIGFLMLMGLAAKNSILLVEYAIEREREGLSQREALLEACRERARPIVMTSLAMMAGMLPTALSHRAGRRVPPAHGHRRDRRPDHLDHAVAGAGAGGLRVRRRLRTLVPAAPIAPGDAADGNARGRYATPLKHRPFEFFRFDVFDFD